MFPPRAPFFLAVSGPAMAGLPPGEARLRPQPSATTLCKRHLLTLPQNLEPARFNGKYPCNSLLLGLGDGTTERLEMALATRRIASFPRGPPSSWLCAAQPLWGSRRSLRGAAGD